MFAFQRRCFCRVEVQVFGSDQIPQLCRLSCSTVARIQATANEFTERALEAITARARSRFALSIYFKPNHVTGRKRHLGVKATTNRAIHPAALSFL